MKLYIMLGGGSVSSVTDIILNSKFELQSRYNVPFRTNTIGKGMNLPIPSAMGKIIPLLFVYENDFDIVGWYPLRYDSSNYQLYKND